MDKRKLSRYNYGGARIYEKKLMIKQKYETVNEENVEELKAFSARFKLSTLDSFKQICKEQSKQYTKVLESLAEAYIESKGSLHLAISLALSDQCTPQEISKILGVQFDGINQNGELSERIKRR